MHIFVFPVGAGVDRLNRPESALLKSTGIDVVTYFVSCCFC